VNRDRWELFYEISESWENSELLISEIGFGSWLTFTDPQPQALAISCVHRALDLGINFLDTANVYGRGAAETVLGEALTGVKRESYVLATKLFFPMSSADRGLSRGASPKTAGRISEATEGRLCGLVPVPSIRRRHSSARDHGGVERAVTSGKVRCIGFSEWPS